MARLDWREIEPWEPEETVGKLWHGVASRIADPAGTATARVALAEVAPRLGVLFRGLGGGAGVEIRATADREAGHRRGLGQRIAAAAEAVPEASFDGGVLRLPESLSLLDGREANAALYVWLAAAAAHAVPAAMPADPLAADLARLAAAGATVAATLAAAPGLVPLYAELSAMILARRPRTTLPPAEAAIEAEIRRRLGDPGPVPDLPTGPAPPRYRPMRAVVLWPKAAHGPASAGTALSDEMPAGTAPELDAGRRTRRARREAADRAARKDSLILYRLEAILSWGRFMNINRRIEDDDESGGRKALDDMDELSLGQISRAPATRLKLHLDLAPEDVDREALAGVTTYPEWDTHAGAYLPDHVRVLDLPPEAGAGAGGGAAPFDAAARRRIRAVRRQFEALRPGRVTTGGHRDGDDLDIDAALRSAVGLRARGEGSDRVWRQTRPRARDLAVCLLLDTSRSTDSACGPRRVIEVEREALAALAWGLDGCGDAVSIMAFNSLRRDRVHAVTCKRFDEAMGPAIEARIAGLEPRFYTRLGAGIRHASASLGAQAGRRRLLVVITDGKPNDLDHYEGRHGIEDSAMAVREARRAGQAVFAITVDRDAGIWLGRIFGRGGFAMVPEADRLTAALPQIWRGLVS